MCFSFFFQMYLMKYGYMDDMEYHHGKSANLLSRDGLRSHIMEFQQFAGINVTGELGKKIHVLKR